MCPPRSLRCTKSIATRTKLFTMGPKTQRNLFFSGKTVEKSIPATPPVSLYKKKRVAGLLMGSCGRLGKSQPIHVRWIRRPDYNEKTLRCRKSIGLPPGQNCSRWVRRHNGISFSPARLLKKKVTSHSVPLVSLFYNPCTMWWVRQPKKERLSKQPKRSKNQ